MHRCTWSRLTLLLLSTVLPLTAQDVHVRVDPHGGGSIDSADNFPTIQNALDHAPQPPAPWRLVIHITPGTYHERINVTRLRPRVTLLGGGTGPEDTVITAAHYAREAGGTYFSETAQVNADEFEAANLTFENTAPHDTPKPGQAVAIVVRSDRAIFKHVRFLSDQDTLFADFGRQYYVDSFIQGGVDFIFGNATAVFDRCHISEIRGGQITAQSRTLPTQTTGFVITGSRITHDPLPGLAEPLTFGLGRPWRPYSRVVVMHTDLPATLAPAGWAAWGRPKEDDRLTFYAEYANTGPGAVTSSATPARVAWLHQLTAAQAAAFAPRTFLRGGPTTDEPRWDPAAAAARLP